MILKRFQFSFILIVAFWCGTLTVNAAQNWEYVVTPSYDAVSPLGEGYYKVEKDGLCGVIDLDGNIISELKWTGISNFYDGVARVAIGSKYNLSEQRFGFIDNTGNVIVEPIYRDSSGLSFSDGLCPVYGDTYTGYIDIQGNSIIDTTNKYTLIYPFSEGLAKVGKGDRYAYINTAGEEVFVLDPATYTWVWRGSHTMIEDCGNFSEGYVWVTQKEKLAFVNTTGEFITGFDYDYNASNYYDFSEGLALVSIKIGNGIYKYGFINTDGELVIDTVWDSARFFSEGLAKVGLYDANNNMKYGYIDKQGNIVIEPKFDRGYEFQYGTAVITLNGNWGILDKDGNYTLNPVSTFNFGLPSSYGLVKSKNAEGKVAYMDVYGNVVTGYDFSDWGTSIIDSFGRAFVKEGDYFGLIKYTGQPIFQINE